MDNKPVEVAKSIIADGSDTYSVDGRIAEMGEQEPAYLEIARTIARETHAGQVDKLGLDYIHHPEAVARQFEERGEWERAAAAWLHDVVEDTGTSTEDLLALGIPPRVVEIVDLMTRKDDVPDDEYYEKIATDLDVLAVKESDIRHNTDPERMAGLEEATRVRLLNKYIHAAEALGLEELADELKSRLV